MKTTLKTIADVLGASFQGQDALVTSVSIDTRTLKEDALFIALSGEHGDGHDFVEAALEKGAAGAVVLTGRTRGDQCVETEDPLAALQTLALWHRRSFRMPVIAVTGTNGKTTTKEMIASVLAQKYRVEKSSGNFNNHIGLPLSICEWNLGAHLAVVEMGMNHLGEIAQLCEIARPTHGVITNIGKGHLEFLGSIEGVAQAKGELVDYLRDHDGTAFLNGDDDHAAAFGAIIENSVLFGLTGAFDLNGTDLGLDDQGCARFSIGQTEFSLPVPGKHNIHNALAAAAVGRFFGLEWEEIRQGLAEFQPADKRMDVKIIGEVTLLDDSYNANPSSVRKALDTLQSLPTEGQRIVVLGDMLELGEASEAEHRKLGETVAEMDFHHFFAYGPEMIITVQRAQELGMAQCRHFSSKEELSRHLTQTVRPGDAVLVKGSRGMRMEETIQGLAEGE